MVKSKTKINKQLKNKKNPELVETIKLARKNKNWLRIAQILSGPRKNFSNFNLLEINKEVQDSDIVAIPGKVLSLGEIDKKIKIVALDFSKSAREKLLKSKIEVSTLEKEISNNPEAKKIKILEKAITHTHRETLRR